MVECEYGPDGLKAYLLELELGPLTASGSVYG